MKTVFSLSLALFLISLASASELKLPRNLEIVSQDSISITVRNKETGLVNKLLLEGQPIYGPGWKLTESRALDLTATLADSCYGYPRIASLSHYLERQLFADCNHNGLTEICGIGASGGYELIYEYTGFNDIYELCATLPVGYGMDYGGDADSDGRLEWMSSGWHSMTLFEAPNATSLPIDSVFAWPWNHGAPSIFPGGFTDLNGDGVTEISFRDNLMRIVVLRCTGDNSYGLDYTIPSPESLLDNYYDYIWGDFDNDGRSEVITVGSMGYVLCFENVEPDSFAFVWSGRVSRWNSFHVAGPADMDRDGKKEFYVLANSISRGGYFIYGFENTGDNSFEQVWTDSIPGNPLGNESSITLYDIDGDGFDELIVSGYPLLAIYQGVADNHLLQIYLANFGNEATPVYDTNHNGRGELFMGSYIYEYTPGPYCRGDVNGDSAINLIDITYLVSYFKGQYDSFTPQVCQADVNGDCLVNGVDVVYLVNFFKGGPALINMNCSW